MIYGFGVLFQGPVWRLVPVGDQKGGLWGVPRLKRDGASLVGSEQDKQPLRTDNEVLDRVGGSLGAVPARLEGAWYG